MKSYDYFHSDDPVEAAKFVVSEAVAASWESVLRNDGFAAFADSVPEQLIRWEADDGWTRRGYGQVAEPSMRSVTGARSGRTTSPRGTRCSLTGSRVRPRTNCLTGSSPAPHSPGRKPASCARGSRSAVVTFSQAAAPPVR
jgi:hypothetical protein